MTFRGHIQDGVVIPDQPLHLPDGTAVEVHPIIAPQQASGERPTTAYERLKDVIGIAEGLPEDMAENHDHYIHGAAKRS